MNYQTTAEELVNRILNLIPKNPQILNMTDVWDLFKVPEFQCDDIGPSLAQASWAFQEAKRLHAEQNED